MSFCQEEFNVIIIPVREGPGRARCNAGVVIKILISDGVQAEIKFVGRHLGIGGGLHTVT